MDWLELHIDTTHTGLEPVETMLSALGIDGVVIDDETEFHDFLESNRQYWDYVDEDLEASMHGKSRVTFYLPADETGFAQMGEVRLALEDLKARRSDCGTLLLSLENLRDEDWENNWKQYYKPMEIGQRLLVIPQWEQVDPGQRVPLILDPGLTFGTGSHATTRLCLTALEKTVAQGDRVLDLGCGSGILSIAALRLGASQALAVDIDDKCLDVAYENAALNGIGKDRYTVRVGDVLSDGSLRRELEGGYDIVVANIVADVIIALAPLVPAMLRPGGTFLCSGIIDDRAEEVRSALEAAGWTVLETQSADGWFATPAGDNITVPGDCAGRLLQLKMLHPDARLMPRICVYRKASQSSRPQARKNKIRFQPRHVRGGKHFSARK
ncbi:MAG: 50S ribosomal protein L11 methyltransferase, partial [Dysosmobacter sp.]